MYADNIAILIKEKELLEKNRDKIKQQKNKETKQPEVEKKDSDNKPQIVEEIFL